MNCWRSRHGRNADTELRHGNRVCCPHGCTCCTACASCGVQTWFTRNKPAKPALPAAYAGSGQTALHEARACATGQNTRAASQSHSGDGWKVTATAQRYAPDAMLAVVQAVMVAAPRNHSMPAVSKAASPPHHVSTPSHAPTHTCPAHRAHGCWWQPPHSPLPAAPQTGP